MFMPSRVFKTDKKTKIVLIAFIMFLSLQKRCFLEAERKFI